MSTESKFGPLRFLAGVWEGTGGVDVAYNHEENRVKDTPYREKTTLKPFGPVDNGRQHLYGLDYKMSAFRLDEENPFHIETGYWMWCPDLGHVMRGFVIPRASTIFAGGPVEPDAKEFTLKATAGDEQYGICSNPYLLENAKAISYEVTIKVDGDAFSYTQDSVLEMSNMDEVLHHTDGCNLTRVEKLDFPPEA
jgi:hypothetical protein